MMMIIIIQITVNFNKSINLKFFYISSNLRQTTTSDGIAWLDYVMRMDVKRTPKRVLEWKPTGRKIRGGPRKRWIEDVEEDIQRMGIRGWRELCKEKTEWKRINEKDKTHSGM